MTQGLSYPITVEYRITDGGVSLCVVDALLQYFLKASMICIDSFTILENGCTPILLQPTFAMTNKKIHSEYTPIAKKESVNGPDERRVSC